MLTKAEQRKFYNSMEWRRKRDETLKKHNYECLWCKREGKVTTKDNAILEVDHIFELEQYPKLALVDDNLRVLCKYHHNQRHDRFEHAPKKEIKWDDEKW
ncbi:HNH endonuclease [Pseudogracilibacillus auburnensis]|uniref:HNH endonuclease n=1 Tax=Pseudogracilibacillus auburnensis TaxID=1494959 RepID=UPI0027DA5817|nr:HNH endonuclease [Pseudogracilibacillus auburnensis]